MGSHKTLNVHLPEWLYREISSEAERTRRTKGQVTRERLTRQVSVTGVWIDDLFGVADDLPADLSTRKDTQNPKYGADGHR